MTEASTKGDVGDSGTAEALMGFDSAVQWASRAEAVFDRIRRERMAGVPVVNPRLTVKFLGLREWEGHWLGILVTPWFMNIVLRPQKGVEDNLAVGSTASFSFPSGVYEFVVGHEEALGLYFSCSLFSPMFEFESQEAAESTAVEALAALMDEENLSESSSTRSEEIMQIWRGEKPRPPGTFGSDDSGGEKHVSMPAKPLSERLAEPLSRRDFLRGKVFTDDRDGGGG